MVSLDLNICERMYICGVIALLREGEIEIFVREGSMIGTCVETY